MWGSGARFVISGLPSSGTDWLVGCFARTGRFKHHEPSKGEFFNPICNRQYERSLKDCFGCETIYHAQHIADTTLDYSRSIAAKSIPEDINLIKDVYGFCYGRWWDTIGPTLRIVRNLRHTFPAKRLRVYSWYESILASFDANHDTLRDPKITHCLEEIGSLMDLDIRNRAYLGHAMAHYSQMKNHNTFYWEDIANEKGGELFENLLNHLLDYDIETTVAVMTEIKKSMFTEASIDERFNRFRNECDIHPKVKECFEILDIEP